MKPGDKRSITKRPVKDSQRLKRGRPPKNPPSLKLDIWGFLTGIDDVGRSPITHSNRGR